MNGSVIRRACLRSANQAHLCFVDLQDRREPGNTLFNPVVDCFCCPYAEMFHVEFHYGRIGCGGPMN